MRNSNVKTIRDLDLEHLIQKYLPEKNQPAILSKLEKILREERSDRNMRMGTGLYDREENLSGKSVFKLYTQTKFATYIGLESIRDVDRRIHEDLLAILPPFQTSISKWMQNNHYSNDDTYNFLEFCQANGVTNDEELLSHYQTYKTRTGNSLKSAESYLFEKNKSESTVKAPIAAGSLFTKQPEEIPSLAETQENTVSFEIG
ncbi:MAG: hypothetical protein KDH94_01315 [Coxiellaceae bacterium]|nr:hypothetical protein [Coxiellaceae bacterium]